MNQINPTQNSKLTHILRLRSANFEHDQTDTTRFWILRAKDPFEPKNWAKNLVEPEKTGWVWRHDFQAHRMEIFKKNI